MRLPRILILLALCLPPLACHVSPTTPGQALTPEPGSALELAIMESLAREMGPLLPEQQELRFTIETLRVVDDWAWIHTRPQSADGSQQYEDVSALLHHTDQGWQVTAIPCTEVENPQCPQGEALYDRLRQDYPQVPAALFDFSQASGSIK